MSSENWESVDLKPFPLARLISEQTTQVWKCCMLHNLGGRSLRKTEWVNVAHICCGLLVFPLQKLWPLEVSSCFTQVFVLAWNHIVSSTKKHLHILLLLKDTKYFSGWESKCSYIFSFVSSHHFEISYKWFMSCNFLDAESIWGLQSQFQVSYKSRGSNHFFLLFNKVVVNLNLGDK